MNSKAANLIASAERIVVKIGSSLLIDRSRREVRRAWLAGLAEDLARLREENKKLVLVSSGAVALGRKPLGLKGALRLNQKQAAAAAGQPLLMEAWAAALAPHGLGTAQLLLTIDDSERRRRWLNARATLDTLLAQGVVPIVNENDSVATQELRYGDNDRLSARAAQMIRSDLLILLSDVDGLYTGDPSRVPDARHIPHVVDIEEIERFAAGPRKTGPGSGGMVTKIEAARIAQRSGSATLIASGREDRPIKRLLDGARATIVAAHGSPANAYKQWIASALSPAGSLSIDAGAVRALGNGKSLLPAGVTAVAGRFDSGACLRVLDDRGTEIARGIAAYDSTEVQMIHGASSAKIADRLGYRGPDEIIHRNDLVLL